MLKLAGDVQSDQDVLTSLENRLLILRELSRAAGADPEPARVSTRRKEWSAGWPAGTDVNTLLTANGMSDQAMDGWCRMNAGITSPAEFLAPENVGKIFAAAAQRG